MISVSLLGKGRICLPKASIAVLLILLIYAGLVLFIHGGDPKAFVMEGTYFRDRDPNGSIGYDGQFAFYIASDPLGAAPMIDQPAYRYLRILYPITAYILSLGGHPSLLPWVMLVINFISVTALCSLLAVLLEKNSLPGWLAVSFLFFLGLLMALRADLNEPLALCLALLGVYFAIQENWRWAGVCLALAILTKEIAAAFLVGIVFWQISRRKYRLSVSLFVSCLIPIALWGILLTFLLQQSPVGVNEAKMELIPFYGLRFLNLSPAKVFIALWVALPAFLFGGLGIVDLLKGKTHLEVWILLANAALLAFMPRLTWINVGGAFRAATGLAVISYLYAASTRPKLVPWISAFWMLSGVIALPSLL